MKLLFAKFLQNAIGLNGWRNEKLHKNVDQHRAGCGNFLCVSTRQIKLSGMSILVAGEAAGIAKLLDFRREVELEDLVVQIISRCKRDLSFLGNVLNDAFQTDAQQCACRSGRQADDGLSLKEDGSNVVRHVFCRSNASLEWIDDLAITKQDDLSASAASSQPNTITRIEEFERPTDLVFANDSAPAVLGRLNQFAKHVASKPCWKGQEIQGIRCFAMRAVVASFQIKFYVGVTQ